MDLPLEVIIDIAFHLDILTLQNFRLASRRFAEAAIPAIGRHGLSALNTFSCLKQLKEFLENYSTLALNTKKLTISHGEWPVCSRDEWEKHPLLFGGNERNELRFSDQEKIDKAFVEYTQFIAEEENRRFSDDVNTIFCLLELLPNLQSMVISHMKTWSWHPSRKKKYRDLQREIWMSPFVNDQVAPTLQILLLAINNKFHNITSLTISGSLDPADLYFCPGTSQFPSIRELRVTCLQVQEDGDVVRRFLRAFPNLMNLSVSFYGWESSIPNILDKLIWPDLKVVRINDLWTSEENILTFFKLHHKTLEQFSLGDTTIVQGTWRSLFTRIRSVCSQTQVTVDGELYGRRSTDTVTIHRGAADRLTRFMQNKTEVWPFGFF
ncbi:hypothetical protein F5884DRAFT_687701 [Xylogone sp. PMI_703]|nr:hypothetical protein F5884DRAFT_687701 [Xylogone sp. PMI_703]